MLRPAVAVMQQGKHTNIFMPATKQEAENYLQELLRKQASSCKISYARKLVSSYH